MSRLFVANAFSISMLPDSGGMVLFAPLALAYASHLMSDGFISAVGHADTAALMSAELGVSVPVDRASIILQPEDAVIIAQYVGPRLPEGTTRLPEGAAFRWWLVSVADPAIRWAD